MYETKKRTEIYLTLYKTSPQAPNNHRILGLKFEPGKTEYIQFRIQMKEAHFKSLWKQQPSIQDFSKKCLFHHNQ